MDIGFIIIISAFIVYYFLLIFIERKGIFEPAEILDKFLSVLLLYAGISIIYYSVTGKPFLNDTVESYNIYIFIIGLISILWTIPNLLKEFRSFRRFFNIKK